MFRGQCGGLCGRALPPGAVFVCCLCKKKAIKPSAPSCKEAAAAAALAAADGAGEDDGEEDEGDGFL